MRPFSLIWAVPVFLLLAAPFSWPYGYYQLLRIIIALSAAFIAWRSHQGGSLAWPWVFAGVVLLYNPIAPVDLGRGIWVGVNLATAGLYLAHWLGSRRATK